MKPIIPLSQDSARKSSQLRTAGSAIKKSNVGRQALFAAALVAQCVASAPAQADGGLFGNLLDDIGLGALDFSGLDISGIAAAGVGILPDYEGASGTQFAPVFAGQFDLEGVRLNVAGPSIRADFGIRKPGKNRWVYGPSVRLRGGRSNVSNLQVEALGSIGTTVEVGGFLGYRWNNVARQNDTVQLRLEAHHDIGGVHNSAMVSGAASYGVQPTEGSLIEVSASANYVGAGYTDRYFGVNTQGAARSGLAAYSGGAGLRDVQLTLTAGMLFTPRWGVIASVSYKRLLDEAADSPIVTDTGTPNQIAGGVGIGYRF